MTPEQLIAALRLPPGAQVGQRIPKKMLAEHGTASSADRQLLQEHIEEIVWVAALKPASAGVAEYRDAQRSYLELAVLCVTLRPLEGKPARVARLAELVHRAIPYPVLLLLGDGQRLHVSLVHIRHAQKEADKTVLDGDMVQAVFERPGPAPSAASAASLSAFLAALDLSRQPRADLHALYQGWFDTLCAWQAAAVTGRFDASASPAQAIARRAALRRWRELDAQIASLRASARQEKQIARQVALNIKIKAVEAERLQAVNQI